MANLTQVRNRVDNWLTGTVWPWVTSRQDTYYTNNGVYWQGLRTHNIEPNHLTAGFADAQPDLLDQSPSDVAQSWLDVVPELNTPIPALFVIDSYGGPDGDGYVASVFVRYNGTLYSRSQNVGPETWRTVAWHEVDETAP